MYCDTTKYCNTWNVSAERCERCWSALCCDLMSLTVCFPASYSSLATSGPSDFVSRWGDARAFCHGDGSWSGRNIRTSVPSGASPFPPMFSVSRPALSGRCSHKEALLWRKEGRKEAGTSPFLALLRGAWDRQVVLLSCRRRRRRALAKREARQCKPSHRLVFHLVTNEVLAYCLPERASLLNSTLWWVLQWNRERIRRSSPYRKVLCLIIKEMISCNLFSRFINICVCIYIHQLYGKVILQGIQELLSASANICQKSWKSLVAYQVAH